MEQRADAELLDAIIIKIFDELTAGEMQIYNMRQKQKLSFSSIAQLLNTTTAAVKQKHYRTTLKIIYLIKQYLKNLKP